MGKVILEFDSYEEQIELRTALDGWKWKSVIWDLDQELRSFSKHGISYIDSKKEAVEEELIVVEKIRKRISDLLDEQNLRYD